MSSLAEMYIVPRVQHIRRSSYKLFNFPSAIHECSESMLSSVLPNVAGNGKKRSSYLCSKNRAIIAQKTNVLCNCMYAKHHFSIGKQWKLVVPLLFCVQLINNLISPLYNN